MFEQICLENYFEKVNLFFTEKESPYGKQLNLSDVIILFSWKPLVTCYYFNLSSLNPINYIKDSRAALAPRTLLKTI